MQDSEVVEKAFFGLQRREADDLASVALIAQDVGVCVDIQFDGEVEQRQDT